MESYGFSKHPLHVLATSDNFSAISVTAVARRVDVENELFDISFAYIAILGQITLSF